MLQEVFAPDEKVISVLRRQSGLGGGELRWSVFLFPLEHGGERYLYHTLTKQCFRVDAARYEAAAARQTAAGEDLAAEPELRTLAESWFLVPPGKDETALFEGLQRLLRLRTARTRLSAYTIMTTSACNARCFYCMENGSRIVTMSPETVEQTVDYILRTRDPARRTHLRWFGGEPLVAQRVIDRVSEALTEAGVDFDASMISNGILIDDAVVARMTGPWRLRRIQISLDGAEEDYNSRKNYLRPYPSAYRELLQVLRRLMDTPIQVVLRCNVDRGNAEGLTQMVDDLAETLPRKERFFPYFTVMFAQRDSEEHAELFHRCLEAKVYAREKGFPYVPQAPLHRMRHTICRAENPYGNTMISPDGLLYNCDAFLPGTESGDIWNGVTRPEYLKTFAMPEPVAAKCRDCCFLTSCTSFTRCPEKSRQCRQVRELELLFDLRCELEKQSAGSAPEGEGEPNPLC